jgi:hypothetical protein
VISLEFHDPPQLGETREVLFAVKRGSHPREIAYRGDERLEAMAEVLLRGGAPQIHKPARGAGRRWDNFQFAGGGREGNHFFGAYGLLAEDELSTIDMPRVEFGRGLSEPLDVVAAK